MRSRVLATTSVAALSFFGYGALSAPAVAQDDEGGAEERIVVTGSRIVRQDYVANSPIVTVDSEEFTDTSSLTVESSLARLPQFTQDARSEFRTTSVEPTTDQTPGTAQVNLRGLGSNRSLVLVDGRRMMPVNGAMVVDVNAIPSSAIERVEIISGGASAVYGADAVGGVVNFILRDDFEGAELSARYGVTEVGDAQSTQLSAIIGADVDGGRGNVIFGADYSTRGPALLFERDWAKEQINNPAVFSLPNFGSNVRPQRVSWTPSSTFAGGSRVAPTQAAVDAIFTEALGMNPGNIAYLLNDDGTLFTTNTGGASPGAAAAAINESRGGYRWNSDPTSDVLPGCQEEVPRFDNAILEVVCFAEVATPLDRYSFFGRGKYEVSDALTLTARGNYASTYTRSQLIYGAGDIIVPVGDEIYLGNAYTPSSLLGNGDTHPNYLPGGAYGLNCGPVGGCTESEAFPLPPELVSLLQSRPGAANEDIRLNVPVTWGDPRGSSTLNDVFQVELGAEGHLGALFDWADDWFWDASVSHGETHQVYQFNGFGSLARFRAVAESPNFGRSFSYTGNPEFAGSNAGSAFCSSGLPIGDPTIEVTQDCIDAYEAIMQNTVVLQQNVVEANLSGDLFEVPAGTVQVAVGASYRDNSIDFNTDQVNDLNNFFDQPLGLFPKSNADGYLSVQEIYGEALIPVISDVPFIQDLSFEIGGRISDFDPSGQVETYKFLGDWSINDFARLRGGYNRATRAPSLNELFAERSGSVAASIVLAQTNTGDYCSTLNTGNSFSANPVTNPTGAAFTEQVCRSLMMRDSVAAGLAPNTAVDAYYGVGAEDGTGDIDGGAVGLGVIRGNRDVGPETADTYTVGLVVTSPFPDNAFLSGFSGSLDWYQIEIEDLIGVRSGVSLARECLTAELNPTGDVTTDACLQLVRNPLSGNGQFVELTYTNSGRAKLSGVDLQVNWRGEFDDLGLNMIPGGAGVNFLATFPQEIQTQASPNDPIIDAVGTNYAQLGIGTGGYDYTTFTSFSYFLGGLTATLDWEYTPSIEDATVITRPASPNVGVPKGASLFALSGSYRLNDNFTLRAGVDNLFNAEPPRTGDNVSTFRTGADLTRTIGGFGGSGEGAGAYDPLGRRYFVGLTVSY